MQTHSTLRDFISSERPTIITNPSHNDQLKFPQSRFSAAKVISSLFLKPEDSIWLDENATQPEQSDYVLYLGCNVLQTPFLMWTCIDVLRKMGIKFAIVGGTSTCCGSPFLSAGKIEAAESFDRKRIDVFSRFNPQTVIEWDESCHEFTHLNTLSYMKPKFKMKNIEQFIAENTHLLKFEIPINKKVGIHDHYGHADNSYADMEAPRRALKAIPGVELIELEHNRLQALPCGFESISYNGRKEEGKLQNRDLLAEASSTGADILAVFWQACYRTLVSTGEIDVRHFIEIVGEALGVNYEDKYRKYKLWNNVDRVVDDAKENIAANGYTETEIKPYVQKYLFDISSTFC